MARRALGIATWISTGLLILTLVLAFASISINPWDHRLSLTNTFHIGVWKTRLVFFNDADYGPSRGSIIGSIDDEGNMYPPLEDEADFGDTAGICYRYFRWVDAELWTLMVSLWYFAAMFAVLPVGWFLWRWRRRGTMNRHLTTGCS